MATVAAPNFNSFVLPVLDGVETGASTLTTFSPTLFTTKIIAAPVLTDWVPTPAPTVQTFAYPIMG